LKINFVWHCLCNPVLAITAHITEGVRIDS